MNSSPLTDLSLRVAEVQCLLQIQGDRRGNEDEINALNRAAVVLLVSHFEGFLQSLAREFVDLVDTGQIESAHIPTGLRELNTVPELERIVNTNDAVQRRALLKKLDRHAALWNGQAKPPRGSLDAALLGRVVTSAQANVINHLFAIMGEQGRVCDGDLDIPTRDEIQTVRIEAFLTDVVACRNAIAHGEADRKPTSGDVKRYVEVVLALSGRLDRKMRALVESIVNAAM